MNAEEDLEQAERYADDDVLAILFRQHADITVALDRVTHSEGQERRESLASAARLMTQHERAEQTVVRPLMEVVDGGGEAADRNAEEQEAEQVLLALSALDVDGEDFEVQLAALVDAVARHAEAEETNEFPLVEKSKTQEERIVLGRQFLAALTT